MKDKDGNLIIGDGEATNLNTEGVAQRYLLATAIKRARSRAILWELGIDAYGEDEVSGEGFVNKTMEDGVKEYLFQEIVKIASTSSKFSNDNGLDRAKLKDFIRNVLDWPKDHPMKKEDFTVLHLSKLLTVIHAMEESETQDSD